MEIKFAMRIKELRQLKALSQTQLAKELSVATGKNIATSTIAMWETDDRVPPAELLSKIADYFGASVDYLLGRPTPQGYITSTEYEAIVKAIIDLNVRVGISNPPKE